MRDLSRSNERMKNVPISSRARLELALSGPEPQLGQGVRHCDTLNVVTRELIPFALRD